MWHFAHSDTHEWRTLVSANHYQGIRYNARPLLESLAASDDHDLQMAAQAVLDEFAKRGQ